MRKTVLALLVALTVLFCPANASAEETLSSTEDIFFTQSELEKVGAGDTKMHPVVWIFVSAGVCALITVAVIINMGKSRTND